VAERCRGVEAGVGDFAGTADEEDLHRDLRVVDALYPPGGSASIRVINESHEARVWR
jgi:hypothetical protein